MQKTTPVDEITSLLIVAGATVPELCRNIGASQNRVEKFLRGDATSLTVDEMAQGKKYLRGRIYGGAENARD